MISICVVTYNDLEFLKNLYHSVKKNTKLKYEFIVHNNASVDGTEEWLTENNIPHTTSATNEGNPALNYAVKEAQYEYVFLPNPDTYLLPNWDVSLLKQINQFKKNNIDKFIICQRCIEPMGSNPEYLIHYCGHNMETFDENKLLNFYFTEAPKRKFFSATQYSFPNCMPKKMWEEFGGMDEEYWPGWTVDVDMAARAYDLGCRDFILLPEPRVYHFINGAYRNMSKEDNAKNGWAMFESKWNMTVEEFRRRLYITKPYKTLEDGLLNVEL